MSIEEQIAVLMRAADEAREQVEYHTREAATHLKRAEGFGAIVATLLRLKSSFEPHT
jgi:hypothetical protein